MPHFGFGTQLFSRFTKNLFVMNLWMFGGISTENSLGGPLTRFDPAAFGMQLVSLQNVSAGYS